VWRIAAVACVATTACGRLGFGTVSIAATTDAATDATNDTADATVLLPTPIGWWKLDESSGMMAADASGHGLTGSVMGGATFTPGHTGNGILVNGSTTQFVKVTDTAALELSGSWSLSLWVWLNAAPANTQMYTLAAKTDAMGFENYSLRIDNNYGAFGATGPGSFVAQFASSTGVDKYAVYTPAAIDVGTWISVVGTWDASAGLLVLYVNGQPLATITDLITTPTTVSGQPFLIGNNAGHLDQGTHGILDDVRIYDVSLSAAEISALYAGG
jgi:hypothetical protein